MKYSIVFFFTLIAFCSFSQTAWKCIYSDSAILRLPDSFVVQFSEDMKEKNLPDDVIENLITKMRSEPISKTRTRYVKANADSTLIDIESGEEGSLRIGSFDSEVILLKQNNLYFIVYGKDDSLVTSPAKDFKLTERQPVFFNYTCKEYISTDSTCTILVAEDLPSCINPGIRTGNIKGAVLFYEMKYINTTVVRCGITKMTKAEATTNK